MTIWMLYMAWALVIATGLLWRLLFGPRCAHKWELVDKIEFPSLMDDARRIGATISNVHGEDVSKVFCRVMRRKRRRRCGSVEYCPVCRA